MSPARFARLAAVIFALIGLVQLVRAVLGWSVVIEGVDIPIWLSWIIVVAAAILAWLGFRSTQADS